MIRVVALALALALGVAGAARADEALIPAEASPLLACDAVAPDWMRRDADESTFSPRVLVPDAGTGCMRTQLLRWRFFVPSERPRALVTLRARYQHGFAAYLDGVEVARRRLPPDATPETLASDLHGPEWEHIPLPMRGIGAGEHVLAVEVHPHIAGREPSFDVELVASEGPNFSIGPYLVDVAPTGALIAFETDVPTTAELAWGAGAELGRAGVERGGGAAARRHLFVIDGLRAATQFYYQVTLHVTW
jgi:hypothetical protein